VSALEVKQNDYGKALHYTVTEKDAATGEYVAVNITDYTLKLLVWKKNAPGTILWTLTGTIVDGPAGEVDFARAVSDFNVAGKYEGEVELIKTGVVRRSGETFSVIVIESPSGV
jgi:hypothetical protein